MLTMDKYILSDSSITGKGKTYLPLLLKPVMIEKPSVNISI